MVIIFVMTTPASILPTQRNAPVAKPRSAPLTHRTASLTDCPLLAKMNYALIHAEKHHSSMTVAQLAERMRGWLANQDYTAIIFERDSEPLAYALYRTDHDGSIYIRQFFVTQEHRRQGIGTASFKLLTRHIFQPGAQVGLEVLAENQAGRSFWTAVGFRSYSITMQRV